MTPRQIESALNGEPRSESAIATLYASREQLLEALQKAGQVSLSDLAPLDRLGRFALADRCWAICTQSVRLALLDDSHAHVRSAAVLAHGSCKP